MQELPKIVVNKLGSGPPPSRAAHPDPDLLTAFMERALPERERSDVMEHLAACAPCREVLALAQPEVAESSLVFLPKPMVSRGFLLRWGALAACAVLAVTLVVRHQPEDHSQVALNHPTEQVAPSTATKLKAKESSHADVTPAKKAPMATRQDDSSMAQSRMAHSRNAEKQLPEVAGSVRQVPVQRDERKNEELATENSPSASGGRIAENTVTSMVAAPAQFAKKTAAQANDQLARADASANKATGSLGAALAKNAQETSSLDNDRQDNDRQDRDAKEELHASSAPMQDAGLSAVRQAALWQITPAGELQRSFNSGKNWESVSLGQPVRLRVLSLSGLQVWAGGNGGALFHSWDGGDHFVTVAVRNAQASLAGDIVVLDFVDAAHGRFETADHEVWTTADGGRTWQKQ